MFAFIVLIVLVSMIVAEGYVKPISDLTYSDSNFGIDFSSKGTVETSGSYFYLLGSFSAFNSTTKAKFEFTRDPSCASSNVECSSIQLYEEVTEVASNPSSTNIIGKGSGESLVVSTDYEHLSDYAVVAKFYYAYAYCCKYNVVASSSTVHA